jgi:hypothetical protein
MPHHYHVFSKKTYTLTGFEPGSCYHEAETMSTALRRRQGKNSLTSWKKLSEHVCNGENSQRIKELVT